MDATGQTRILIVDDHPIVRDALAEIFKQETDFVVCGGAGSVQEALQVIREKKPAVVLVDISLRDDVSGIELIRQLVKEYPEISSIVFSMHDEMLYAERAIRAGARGYVMKTESSVDVVAAVREVLAGRLYLSGKMSEFLLERFSQSESGRHDDSVHKLTDREMEVFHLLGYGWRSREISDKLGLSVKTVDTYRLRMRKKLGLASGTALLKYAIEWKQQQ